MHNLFREARKKKGLTQAQVAAAIGRDQSTVAKYEAGARVHADVAPRLAEVLDLGVLDVLYGPQPASEPLARVG